MLTILGSDLTYKGTDSQDLLPLWFAVKSFHCFRLLMHSNFRFLRLRGSPMKSNVEPGLAIIYEQSRDCVT